MTSVRTSESAEQKLPATSDASVHAPMVLDIGSRSKKQIKKLRRGDGKLMDRISMAIEELKSSGNISAAAQPLVIVVRERREKGLTGLLKS